MNFEQKNSKNKLIKAKKKSFIQLVLFFKMCNFSKKKKKKLLQKIIMHIWATCAVSSKSVAHNLYKIICALSKLNSAIECS